MNNNQSNVQEHDSTSRSSEAPQFQDRPERRPQRRLPSLILLGLGAVIVIGAVIAAFALFSHPSTTNTGNTSATATTGVSSQKGSGQCDGTRLPTDTVRQETANGLHLTVAQVETQVGAGKTISQIATAQNISASQLRTIEVNALQTANARWLGLHCITQSDVNDNMRRDVGAADYMDYEFTNYFK